MNSKETIYILGSGAIGLPLAAYLANAGRKVIAVRTSRDDTARGTINVRVNQGADCIDILVETISLSRLTHLDGMIVVAAKAYANNAIARELKNKKARGPVVLLQNGLGVEKPFLDLQLSPIYRGVLYITSQAASANDFTVSPITSSPLGIIDGHEAGLRKCVEELLTGGFSFRAEMDIQREIWKKAIINSVFNSVCPLLEVDNGIFARDVEVANLGRRLVRECVALTDRLNIGLSESELIEQIMQISRGSDQLISTLQDLRMGRRTEIEFLNLEIARVAASMQPRLEVPRVELLGKMILTKSILSQSQGATAGGKR